MNEGMNEWARKLITELKNYMSNIQLLSKYGRLYDRTIKVQNGGVN
jgi:hypothetical protein